jgi:hypothetical protein
VAHSIAERIPASIPGPSLAVPPFALTEFRALDTFFVKGPRPPTPENTHITIALNHRGVPEINLSAFSFLPPKNDCTNDIQHGCGGLLARLLHPAFQRPALVTRYIEPMSTAGQYAAFARLIGFNNEIVLHDTHPVMSALQLALLLYPDDIAKEVRVIFEELRQLAAERGIALSPGLRFTADDAATRSLRTAARAYFQNRITHQHSPHDFDPTARGAFLDELSTPRNAAVIWIANMASSDHRDEPFSFASGRLAMRMRLCVPLAPSEPGSFALLPFPIDSALIQTRFHSISQNLLYWTDAANPVKTALPLRVQHGAPQDSLKAAKPGDLILLNRRFIRHHVAREDGALELDSHVMPPWRGGARVLMLASVNDRCLITKAIGLGMTGKVAGHLHLLSNFDMSSADCAVLPPPGEAGVLIRAPVRAHLPTASLPAPAAPPES